MFRSRGQDKPTTTHRTLWLVTAVGLNPNIPSASLAPWFSSFVPMLPAEISVAGERLVLHPHRALYWDRLRWLVVSDLHLGKAAHVSRAALCGELHCLTRSLLN